MTSATVLREEADAESRLICSGEGVSVVPVPSILNVALGTVSIYGGGGLESGDEQRRRLPPVLIRWLWPVVLLTQLKVISTWRWCRLNSEDREGGQGSMWWLTRSNAQTEKDSVQ
jgi:hypothetical protein